MVSFVFSLLTKRQQIRQRLCKNLGKVFVCNACDNQSVTWLFRQTPAIAIFSWIICLLAAFQSMDTNSLLFMKIHGQFMAIRVQNKNGTSRKTHYKIVESYAAQTPFVRLENCLCLIILLEPSDRKNLFVRFRNCLYPFQKISLLISKNH